MNKRGGFSIVQVLVAAGLAALVMSVLASATHQGLQAQLNVERKGAFENDIRGLRQLLADSKNCKQILDLLDNKPVTSGGTFPIPYSNQKYGSSPVVSGPVAFSALRPGNDYKVEKIQLSIGAFNRPPAGATTTALGSLEVAALKTGSNQMGGSSMQRSIALAVVIDEHNKAVACGEQLDGKSVCSSLGGTWDPVNSVCDTNNLLKPGMQAGFCMQGWMGLEFDPDSVVEPAYADKTPIANTELSGCRCKMGWVLRPTGYLRNLTATEKALVKWLKGQGRHGSTYDATDIAYYTCVYMPKATCRQKYPFNHAQLFPNGIPYENTSPCPY